MVDTRSTRQPALSDILVTDGEALSIPRSVDCWEVQAQLSPSCVLLPPKGSSMVSEGSNWSPSTPYIQLHLGNCLHLHSLPKSFPSLSRDGAADEDTEVESQQLFPLLHGSMSPHKLLPPSSPPPPGKERPLLWTWASSRVSLCRFLYFGCESGPDTVRSGSLGAWSGLSGPCCALLDCGNARPSYSRGPVYGPERSKSVSSSGCLHLFLHLLQLLV